MGLAAPLWRRWPQTFDVTAVCIGTVMPDVVDGLVGATQGHLGQGVGHSLIGLALLCVPGGLALWFASRSIARRFPLSEGTGFWARCRNAALEEIWTARPFGAHAGVILFSLAIGTLSHLVTDVISHAECPWFYPWLENLHLFPGWWTHVWFRMPVPGYGSGYPFAPHFISWLLLSVVGGWWLLKPVWSATNAVPDGLPAED